MSTLKFILYVHVDHHFPQTTQSDKRSFLHLNHHLIGLVCDFG